MTRSKLEIELSGDWDDNFIEWYFSDAKVREPQKEGKQNWPKKNREKMRKIGIVYYFRTKVNEKPAIAFDFLDNYLERM